MNVNDLEDKIMSVWSTADDIDTFLYRYLDSPAEELSKMIYQILFLVLRHCMITDVKSCGMHLRR